MFCDSQKPLLEKILREGRQSVDKLFVAVTDKFELCLAKCRTSSKVGHLSPSLIPAVINTCNALPNYNVFGNLSRKLLGLYVQFLCLMWGLPYINLFSVEYNFSQQIACLNKTLTQLCISECSA